MASTNKVARAQPSLTLDGVEIANRGGRYGEQYVIPTLPPRIAIADEGAYFTAKNPISGTGIATIAAADADDPLETYILLRNTAAVGGRRAYLDYLWLNCTVAGVGHTSSRWTMSVDEGIGRYTSGAAMTAAPTNVNMESSEASVCTCIAGPLVTTAAVNARRIAHGILRAGVINVVGDVCMFFFNGGQGPAFRSVAEGVTQMTAVIPVPPIVVGPQQSFLFSIWGASMTVGIAFEINLGWYER